MHSLCVAWNIWENDGWGHLHLYIDENPELSVWHCLDYGRRRYRVDCPWSIMSMYSTASKLSFAGTLNIRICPLGSRAVRRPHSADAADNLWVPPPTFVDR